MNASEILLSNAEKYAIMLATTVDLKSNIVQSRSNIGKTWQDLSDTQVTS